MNLPPFLITIVAFALVLNIVLAVRSRSKNKGVEKFIEEEYAADNAPIKPIPAEMLYVPDTSVLPLTKKYDLDERNAEKLKLKQENVSRKASLGMLHFLKSPTNKELKLAYGGLNLQKVVLLEEHFSQFMFAVCGLGEFLSDNGLNEDASVCFNFCVEANCDISKPYIFMSNAYAEKKDIAKIKGIRTRVEGLSIPAKDKIIAHLDSLLTGQNAE